MIKLLLNIVYSILPFCEYSKANKKVFKRIKEINENKFENNLKYVEKLYYPDNIDIDNFYQNTLDIKKSLEEKAKVSLFSVTLSISLIIGLLTFILQQSSLMNNYWFVKFGIVILGLMSVFYMFLAAFLSLNMLSNKIMVYQLFPSDLELSEQEQIRLKLINIEQNANMNTIRNNNVFTSYKSIINSLICLLLLFFLIGFNVLTSTKDNDIKRDIVLLREKTDCIEIKLDSLKNIITTIENNNALNQKNVDDRLNAISNKISEIKSFKKK